MNHDSSSPVRVAPVTARGQATRLRIVRAAEVVFGEKGYDGASIAEICRLAETALGSFYVYFPDKKAAFVELVDSLGARLRADLAAAVVGLEDRFDIERAGLRAFFAFAGQHRRLYRIVGQAEFVDEAVFRRYYERLAEGYVRGLARAMAKGQLRKVDAEVLAYALMGMTDFLGMRWVLWEENADVGRIVDAVLDLLRHGVAVRADAVKTSKPAKAGARRAHR